jgi:hypothetical protein
VGEGQRGRWGKYGIKKERRVSRRDDGNTCGVSSAVWKLRIESSIGQEGMGQDRGQRQAFMRLNRQ